MDNKGLIQLKDISLVSTTTTDEMIAKWVALKKQNDSIKVIDKENTALSKEIKANSNSAIKEIEEERLAVGRIITKVREDITSKADELKKPFQEIKESIEWKIVEYKKEEEAIKKAESDRRKVIIDKINWFTDLEELKAYYKSLNANDKRKADIAYAGTTKKEEIIELEVTSRRNIIKNKIEDAKTVEELWLIDMWDFKDELAEMIWNKVNKLKVEALEAEKKQKIEDEQKEKDTTEKHIETLHPLTIEELKVYKFVELPWVKEETIKNWIIMRINTLETIATNKKLKELEAKNKKLEDEKVIEDKAKELLVKKEAPKVEVKAVKTTKVPKTTTVTKKQETRARTIEEIPEMLRKIEGMYWMNNLELDEYLLINV